MPDVKEQISSAAQKQFNTLPAASSQKASDEFVKNQDEFASKVTHVFSDSLQRIFIVASCLIGLSAVFVFTLKEKTLRSAKPSATPGEL